MDCGSNFNETDVNLDHCLEQFQGRNFHKTHEKSNKFSYCFGKIVENMVLSHIHLVVLLLKYSVYVFVTMSGFSYELSNKKI